MISSRRRGNGNPEAWGRDSAILCDSPRRVIPGSKTERVSYTTHAYNTEATAEQKVQTSQLLRLR